MSVSRTDRTIEKIRRGALPRPTEHGQLTGIYDGPGRPCDGCGDAIHPSEILCTVTLPGMELRFHEECYNAWATFSQPLY